MFKKTSRCSILVLLTMGVMALGFSSIANAQLHGASIAKGCGPPIRACDNDADCSDGDECTTNVCDDVTYPNNIVNCTVEITNIDGFNDTVSIPSVMDVLTASVGAVNTPSTDMAITPLDGATCSAPVGGQVGSWSLPCLLPKKAGLAPGRIQLVFDSYNPVLADVALSPLADQASAVWIDLCSDPGTEGCSEGTLNDLQAPASQVVVDACGTTPVVCDPGDACNTPFCDPATGCGTTPVVCAPGDACNTPFCDPATGCGTTPVVCAPGDACNTPFCDPATGCGTTPVVCAPGDACNTPFCDPATGCGTTPVVCDPGDACNTPFCDPATGCGTTPVVCDPGDACNTPFCDPATGCGTTPVVCDPGDACNTPFCDPATGCGTTPVVCDPGDACNTPFCDPATGCGTTPVACPPPADPECFVSICDPITGCGEEEIMPIPAICQDNLLCRTPGFWGRRGGDEKSPKSQNITQQVIDEVGFLDVCGVQITNTDLGSSQSAIEGICQSPAGTIERQLFRQLTSAALNCVMSGGGNDCTGVNSIDTHYADCNTLCAGGPNGGETAQTCIDGLDCFNNGGTWIDGDNMCLNGVGFCWDLGATESPDDDTKTMYTCDRDGSQYTDGCIENEECRAEETCHERELCQEDGLCFEPPGPASSPKKCNTARKNPPSLPY